MIVSDHTKSLYDDRWEGDTLHYTGKAAARGLCDLYGKQGPFIGPDKTPFLKCHHVAHLANGGDDTIENAVAL